MTIKKMTSFRLPPDMLEKLKQVAKLESERTGYTVRVQDLVEKALGDIIAVKLEKSGK
jgi:predicted DNA-binding protein